MEIKFGEAEIKDLLGKVKIFKPELGEYQLFTTNESFNYFVKLSNGSVTFTIDDLIDNQNQTLTPETLSRIAASFKSSGNIHQRNSTNETTAEQTSSSSKNAHIPINSPQKKSSSVLKPLFIVVGLMALLFVAIQIYNEYKYQEYLKKEGNETGAEYDFGENTKTRQKTEEELQAELFAKEQSNPKKYLSAQFRYKLNLLNQIVIDGDLYNNATICTFKNIVVTITAYSKTDAVLDTKQYTIMEFVQPNGQTPFRLKTANTWDSRTNRIELTINDAEGQ